VYNPYKLCFCKIALPALPCVALSV
jgi:hypothetical protein